MGEVSENYEERGNTGKIIRVPCTVCSGVTRHKVVQSYFYSGQDVLDAEQGFYIAWSTDFQTIQCQGCSTVTFRELEWFSEDECQIGPQEWDDGTKEKLYPKRSEETLIIKDFRNSPPNLRRIYREAIDCYNDGSLTLCAGGLRALVEGLCSEQGVKNGPVVQKDGAVVNKRNLEGKIAGLHERGILTKREAEALHEHRFLGNEAVHELAQPSSEELKIAFDIIEHVFESVYEIPDKVRELNHRRRKRTAR